MENFNETIPKSILNEYILNKIFNIVELFIRYCYLNYPI